MRRHSHWRQQQQRDLADIFLSLFLSSSIPSFYPCPRFCYNSIPSILFLQGRHVAERQSRNQRVGRSPGRWAKVAGYANKMRPIRSSCTILTTNTNWFVQSNPFVIFFSPFSLFFSLLWRYFTPARLFLIYSVYIIYVCVGFWCPLHWKLHTTTILTVYVRTYVRIYLQRENRLGNSNNNQRCCHVGWLLLLLWGGKYWIGYDGMGGRRVCSTHTIQQTALCDSCVTFPSLHERFET